MRNINLGKTQITDNIRVSSAAIFYEWTEWGVPYFQYETWIFSDNPEIKSRMFIWGTSNGNEVYTKMSELTERAHKRISDVMINQQK